MDEIAIIIPAVFQSWELYAIFKENLLTMKHRSLRSMYIMCNKQNIFPEIKVMSDELNSLTEYPIHVVADKERSVAGAWNRGIEMACEEGIETFLLTSIDVTFTASTVSGLIQYRCENPDALLWSGQDLIDDPNDSSVLDECALNCAMLTRETIAKVGWFDKEYKPAYYEDVDYVTRAVLAGVMPKKVCRSYYHHREGSLTVKMDPDVMLHVRAWDESRRQRFLAKWKIHVDDYSKIREYCYSTPYDSGKPVSWWPEQDRAGYSPAGGINE